MRGSGAATLALARGVGISDGPNLDAFSRVRVSFPQLQFSTLFDTADRVLYWTTALTGGGTSSHHAASSTMRLAVGAAAGDRVVRQSKEYFSYRAAQSQLIFTTFKLAAAQAGTRQRVGYFDDTEGIFLELDGSTVSVVIKSSVTGVATEVRAAQAAWSLDKLDGAGPSRVTLDLSVVQIFVVDFQWLGVGRVRLGFDIGGVIIYFHEFEHANEAGNLLPYIRTPKLPVRYEVENTAATAGASEMTQICSAVTREGATDDPGVQRAVWSAPDASATSTTTLRTVLGVRLRAANIRATLRALEQSLSNIDTEVMVWALVLNPGGTGGAVWADIPGGDSIAQYSRSQIAVGVDAAGLPNGALSLVLAAGVLAGGQGQRGESLAGQIAESTPVAADYAGTPDELWLCCRQVSGAGTVMAAMTFKETR